MTRIIINGINGKMGQAICALALADADRFDVVAGADFNAVACGLVPFYSNISDVKAPADVIIDFSRPDALEGILAHAKANKMNVVIGTTGLSDSDRSLIKEYSEHIAVFESGNMSIGVNLQLELVKKAASALGDTFDVEIIEKHHNEKADSPSGTCLMLAEAINSQYKCPKEYVFGRHSADKKRESNEIGIHSVRGGTIVGEHQVHFIGEDEVIEITHYAYSKRVLAAGALRAASFIHGKNPGIYNMDDMLRK